MTFALTGFRAVAENSSEAIASRFRQVFILDITAANTDLVHDLDDFSGTFWTDVDTSAGSIGEKALKAFKDLVVAKDQLAGIESEALQLKEKKAAGATLAAGQYKIDSFTNSIPSITFFTAEGPTAYTLRLEYDLQADVNPILVEA